MGQILPVASRALNGCFPSPAQRSTHIEGREGAYGCTKSSFHRLDVVADDRVDLRLPAAAAEHAIMPHARLHVVAFQIGTERCAEIVRGLRLPERADIDPAAALPEDAVSRDRILTNVSLHWFTGDAGSAANLYYETLHDPAVKKRKVRNDVPTGVAVSLSQDVTIRSWAERENNIVHWTEFDHGGHFAALEVPDVLVDDVRKFFRKVR